MKLKIVYLIAAMVGAVFCIIPLMNVIKSAGIKSGGLKTEGVVTDVYRTSLKNPFHRVTVDFKTTDEKEVTATASSRTNFSKGDKVQIWYDTDIPQKIDFGDTIRYNMRGVVIGGFVFLFFFYLFIKYSLRERANRNLVRSGLKVPAEFVSISRNEKYRMGDKNPWVINCRWTDKSSNKEYSFVSKDYTIDPSPYLGGRNHIDVYIDPADPGKYFMDTSYMPGGNITIG